MSRSQIKVMVILEGSRSLGTVMNCYVVGSEITSPMALFPSYMENCLLPTHYLLVISLQTVCVTKPCHKCLELSRFVFVKFCYTLKNVVVVSSSNIKPADGPNVQNQCII